MPLNTLGQGFFRYDKEQLYAVLDCESCNLNLGLLDNKPWEWSIIEVRGEEILKKHDLYVKWDNLAVSRDAARITNFNPQIIESRGKDPKEVLDIVDSYFYSPKHLLIIHNGLNFDLYLQSIHRRALGLKPDYSYVNRILDTNALFKGYKLNKQPESREKLLEYQYRLANHKQKGLKSSLKHCCKEFEIEYRDDLAHSALYDCEVLLKFWNKLKWNIEC